MPTVPLHIRNQPGLELFDTFLSAVAEVFPKTCNLSAATDVQQVDVNGRSAELLSNGALTQFRQRLERFAFVEISRLDAESGGVKLKYARKDSLSGQLFLETQDQQDSDRQRLYGLLETVIKHFAPLRRQELVLEGLPQAQQEVLKAYERTTAELGTKVAEVGRLAAEQITRNQAILDQKLADLEKRYEQKANELEASYGTKRLELDNREKQLNEQAQEFDLKKRMAARRENFHKLEELLDQEKVVSVSAETEAKRSRVHLTCIAVLAISSILMLAVIATLLIRQSFDSRLLILFSVSSVIFASTLIYYLLWNNQWFSVLAQLELSNRKLRSDIILANWLAELYLESKENSQIDIPPELLANFSQNLFRGVEFKHTDHHPIEKLLKATKGLKVEVGNGPIKIERK